MSDAKERNQMVMSNAIRNDELLLVADLLTQGVKPTMDDFVVAVEQKSYPILEMILNNDFNINEPLRTDYPPPLAVAASDPELLTWLVQHGADPNARCMFDITPLSIAVQRAPATTIRLLFNLGASVKHGQPLHYAVRHGQTNEVIELLLDRGASPNKLMFEDDDVSFYHFKCLGLGTPLHEASRRGDGRMVQLLLTHGADPSIADSLGSLPLDREYLLARQ